MLTSVLSLISTGFNACWSWLAQLFASVPDLLSFFMAVFTFTCICRFFVYPILGGSGLRSNSRKEERPSNE